MSLSDTPMLLGPARAVLGLSASHARRVLDAAGAVVRDSSGRRVVLPAVLARVVAERAAAKSQAVTADAVAPATDE